MVRHIVKTLTRYLELKNTRQTHVRIRQKKLTETNSQFRGTLRSAQENYRIGYDNINWGRKASFETPFTKGYDNISWSKNETKFSYGFFRSRAGKDIQCKITENDGGYLIEPLRLDGEVDRRFKPWTQNSISFVETHNFFIYR